MVAALNRFISRSADRCRPFYQLLHKWKDFQWTEECALAFEDLKRYLASPPILSRPEKEEVLYAYLAITDYAISLVLGRNDDGIQKHVYYVSKSLQEAEMHYLPLEKAVLAITAIKGQVLTDFVAEFTEDNLKKEEVILTVTSTVPINVPPWEVYTDGVFNRKEARIWIVLITLERLIMEKSLRLGFIATNNEAEYEALLVRALMVRQSKSFVVKQIPKRQNAHADSLAMLATSLGSKLLRVVLVEDMMNSSLASIPTIGIHSIQVGPSWMDPIVTFLKQGILLEDKTEAKKVHRNAPRYWLSKEQKLYKRSYLGPYLLGVHLEVVEPILEELHEGICGSHTGGRSLAHRALT
ncbi:uncharacterized protein LOC142606280 [Castanea sativa]|uniref:uncharacterized protein LOC142606280 n=1 Tax=Castanea sativa TaxID=21020 RepID=UPI003F64F622